jgi:peptidoglycan/LPS O-acetylase OafA/YrhL
MQKLEYRPEINGLRALAVLAVVVFHADASWLPGGFLGVDVFFVISGFLITSIILHAMHDGTFSFIGFWRKRIRRILPALTLVTACTLLAYLVTTTPPVQRSVGIQALAALGSFTNVYFWQARADYWGLPEAASPFMHVWSLAIEEQFYILYPIIAWIAFRRRPGALKWLLASGTAVSIALLLVSARTHPAAAFYLLPTRAWELGAGCLVAVMSRYGQRSHRVSGLLALVGLGMVLWGFVRSTRFDATSALAVVGTGLILQFGRSGRVASVLSLPAAVHVGKISYSLYLWHWPVFVLARQLGWDTDRPAEMLVCVGASYVLSLASFRYVELPMRRHGRVGMIVGTTAIVACAAALLSWMPRECDVSGYAKPHTYVRYYDLSPKSVESPEIEAILADMEAPVRTAPADAYCDGGIIIGESASHPRVVVLGNSHGTMWSDAIRSVVEELGLKMAFISVNGEPVFMSLPLDPNRSGSRLDAAERYAYDQSRLELIERWRPDLVIICCPWSRVSESQTRDLMTFLERHAGRVLLMEQVPEIRGVGNASVLAHLAYLGFRPEQGVKQYLPAGNVRKVEQGRALVQTLASTYANCGLIQVHDMYARGRDTLVLDGSEVVYFDDDHLTTYGARLAVPLIDRAIREALTAGAHSQDAGAPR